MAPDLMTLWLDWVMTPLSGAAVHQVPDLLSWHGRLMVLSWGFALPVSILIARFFKVTQGQNWPQVLDNKFWWHSHRGLAITSAALSLFALGCALAWNQGAGSRPTASLHAWLGWLVLGLLALQFASAYLRGTKGGPTAPRLSKNGRLVDLHGDHYNMTPRRYWFERIHKSAGYTALLTAQLAMLTGLGLSDAPRWMPISLMVAWLAFMLVFIRWQRQGRCLDTYQAIWGPGMEHPGNSMSVSGWGVRRIRPPDQAMQDIERS
jgi:hypothetical protein